MFGVVGRLRPYRDISSAFKASKVISRKLDLGRFGTGAAFTIGTAPARTNSVTTSAAEPTAGTIAVLRVIFSPRKASGLVPTSLRDRGIHSATAKATK